MVRRAPKKVLAALRRELQPAELFGIKEEQAHKSKAFAKPFAYPPIGFPKRFEELFGIEELPLDRPDVLAKPKRRRESVPPFRVPKKYRRTFWDKGGTSA